MINRFITLFHAALLLCFFMCLSMTFVFVCVWFRPMISLVKILIRSLLWVPALINGLLFWHLLTCDGTFCYYVYCIWNVFLSVHLANKCDDVCTCGWCLCAVEPDLAIETTDDGTVNVIYFQDADMKRFFDKYPELILLDATYKLTNVRMALYVMMCIGPNGESEIVAVAYFWQLLRMRLVYVQLSSCSRRETTIGKR